MTADLYLSNATVYDVTRFDVEQGQEFSVLLNGDPGTLVRVFANNDAVLDMDVVDNTINMTAAAMGTSEIQVQHADTREVLLMLTVKVTNPDAAASLGITAGDPVLK